MYTTMVLFALTGFSSAAEEAVSLSWLNDYPQARKQGVTDKKPVAVVFASGQEGWDKLVREGSLAKEHKQLLATNYVCLYVDTSTEEGKRLARTFDVGKGVGLIISDHTGNYMALHHQGDLEGKTLTSYLNRYADAERVVRTTEGNGVQTRTSYYPPAAQTNAPVFAGRSC